MKGFYIPLDKYTSLTLQQSVIITLPPVHQIIGLSINKINYIQLPPILQ